MHTVPYGLERNPCEFSCRHYKNKKFHDDHPDHCGQDSHAYREVIHGFVKLIKKHKKYKVKWDCKLEKVAKTVGCVKNQSMKEQKECNYGCGNYRQKFWIKKLKEEFSNVKQVITCGEGNKRGSRSNWKKSNFGGIMKKSDFYGCSTPNRCSCAVCYFATCKQGSICNMTPWESNIFHRG